ncbi:MAG: endolytic transglycosylase MltG [Actinomycetia bacterium]|nr:endolytic transglycosylase MltG [Actinomycetes bacterium]
MTDQDTTNPSAGSGTRKYLWVLLVALGAIVLIGLFFGARFAAGLVGGSPWDVIPGQPVEVVIEPGTPANTIYVTLNDAGVVRASEIREEARRVGVEDQLQAGVYSMVTDMEPGDVIRQLLSGGSPDVVGTFTVIEGWTIERILTELGDQTDFSETAYRAALGSGEVTSPLLPDTSESITTITRWEGILFPAKYEITEESTPATILQRMSDEMVDRLGPVDWSRIDDLDITRYDAIIIASLIQREAGTDADRPLISSVIHNRLLDDIRLQIDATVVYAIGDVNGRVTAEDLKVPSPYNTYRVDGLPPTPIGTVQIISVDAAVNPADTDYYFYVLARADGSHAFATTYEEHKANIQKAKEAGVLP